MKVPLLIINCHIHWTHSIWSSSVLKNIVDVVFFPIFYIFFPLELQPHSNNYIKKVCFVRLKNMPIIQPSYNLSTTLDLLYSLLFIDFFFFFFFLRNLVLSLYAVNRCIIPRVSTFTPRVRWRKGIKETELILINDQVAWIVFTLLSSVEEQILASESFIWLAIGLKRPILVGLLR